MTAPVRIGVRFQPHWPPEELPAFARRVEALGFDELWFSEDCFWAGGIAMAATTLASTTTLGVGLGLLPATTRNVATLAMELGALARMAPDRLTVALGHGVPEWMDQIGVHPGDRMTALEERTRALRALLAGAQLTLDGAEVQLRDVGLGFPPTAVVPILIGTTGPKGLALAGRVADGIVLPELSSPAAIRWAREQTGGAGTTVVFGVLGLEADRDEALASARPEFERWVRSGVFPRLTELAGLGADGQGELDDDTFRAMAVVGDRDDAAATVAAWRAAGADRVVVLPRTPGGLEQVERFAAEVLPLVRGADAAAIG